MSKTQERSDPSRPRVEAQKERTIFANKTYCTECEQKGIRICSWESFSGWQDYVGGSITDNQLAERADRELKQMPPSFSTYTVTGQSEPASEEEETSKRQRAKVANKIYKEVCTDSGMSHCFFKNFSTWSDYVQGKMDEAEFSIHAKREVEKMAAEGN